MRADAPGGRGRQRLIAPDEVGPQGLTTEIVFDKSEREALKRRLDLLALERLAAELRFERTDGGAIRVSGSIQAQLAQSCVVTLEPVPRTISEPVSVLFAPVPADAPEREVEVLAEGDEAEPLPADGIDVSEIVAEHLALVLDPYPRHPDAPDEPLTYAAGAGEAEKSAAEDDTPAGPFAALGQLKSKL